MKKILFYLLSFLLFNILLTSCEIENKLNIFSNNDSTFSSPTLSLKNDTLTWDKKAYALAYYVYINGTLNKINGISDTFYYIDKNNFNEGEYSFQVAILSYNGTLNTNVVGYKSNIITKNIYNKNIKNLSAIINKDTVKLTWDTHPAANSYKIYRDSSLIASSLNNSYYDYALSSKKYLYYIGFLYDNQEFYSDTLWAFVDYGFQINNFTASKSAYHVFLNWQSIEIPKYYQIYRNSSLLVSNYSKISYVDSNLSKGTYNYYISAIYDIITSKSDTKTIEIGTNKLSNFSAIIENKNKVKLSWTKEEIAQKYIIYRNDLKIAQVNSLTSIYYDNNLSAGDYEYQVSFIYSQTSIESEKTAKIKISVLSKIMQLSTSSLAFGRVELGRSKTMSFYIQNTGTDTIHIDSFSCSNSSVFKALAYQGNILPNSQQIINSEFLPLDTLSYLASASVYSNADTLNLSLVGTCYGIDSLSNFKAEISNVKNVNLTWNLDDRANKYIIYRNNVKLAEVDSLTSSYTDLNLAEGTYAYQISFVYSKIQRESGKTSKRELTIVRKNIQLSTNSLAFGNVEIGRSKTMSFYIQNTGVDAIQIDSIVCSNSSVFKALAYQGNILPNSQQIINSEFLPLDTLSYQATATIYCSVDTLSLILAGTCYGTDSLSNFKAEISNVKNVNLSWNLDDRANKYIIYKNNVKLAEVDSLTSSYTDLNLAEGTYAYQISFVYSKIPRESGKTSKRELNIVYNKLSITYLLSFGEVEINTSKTLSFSIKNAGYNTITIDSIIYPIAFSGSKEAAVSISAGQTNNVNISFTPTQVISYTGKVLIYSNSENKIDTLSVEGVCKTSSSFVKIVGGDFSMGADTEIDSMPNAYQGETPKHSVAVSTFYMSKYETTNNDVASVYNWALSKGYIKINGNSLVNSISGDTLIDLNSSEVKYNSVSFYTNKGNYPVSNISWIGAVYYCNFKSEMEGRTSCYNLSASDWPSCDLSKNGYRLPTEAEWEYASKGGKYNMTLDPSLVYSGRSNIADVAYYVDNSGYSTHPVGEKTSNVLGLYDMSGNVWELCNDFLDVLNSDKSSSYYTSCNFSGKVSNPTGVDISIAYPSYYGNAYKSKARRGGGYSSLAIHCRSTNRGGLYRTGFDPETGFRIVYRDN